MSVEAIARVIDLRAHAAKVNAAGRAAPTSLVDCIAECTRDMEIALRGETKFVKGVAVPGNKPSYVCLDHVTVALDSLLLCSDEARAAVVELLIHGRRHADLEIARSIVSDIHGQVNGHLIAAHMDLQ